MKQKSFKISEVTLVHYQQPKTKLHANSTDPTVSGMTTTTGLAKPVKIN